MRTLIIATRNAHKTDEIQEILGPAFRLLSLRDFPGAPNTIEDATSFEGNSTKKATDLARWLGESQMLPPADESSVYVLADDSGLEVDALGGAPGVYSARFAALDTGQPGNSSDSENNRKLLRLISHVPEEKRTARFRCVLALTPVPAVRARVASDVCLANESEIATQIFSGACEGRILREARGAEGFGYDPLFVPDGRDRTFAELGAAEKNELSHRARALADLKRSRWFTSL